MHLPLASTLLLSRADLINNRPDYSRDAIPLYPSMREADGSDISVDNLRGTRLYGWKGCTSSDADAIAGAFDDFSKLAKPLGASIDWAGEIAEDFWGKNEGKYRVPDERRKQIQQIFQAQQQMYAIGWHISPPYWTSLWIEVCHSFIVIVLGLHVSYYQYRSVAAAETTLVIRIISAWTRSPTMDNAVEAAHPPVATTTRSKPTRNPRRRIQSSLTAE
jgi:hypothetical protein